MRMTLPIVMALLVVYVFWGGTYLAMKVAIETLPPFTMAGIRFLIAGVLVYVWQRVRGVEKPKAIHWKNTAIIGVIMLLGGNGSIVWAEQFVSSGIAAIVFATVPFWVALLSWLWQGDKRPNRMVFGGLALGIMGISFLVNNSVGEISNTTSQWFGYIALVIASLFWAVGALYSRVAKVPSSPFMAAALQMIAGGASCLLFGFTMGEWTQLDFSFVSIRSVIALGYLILFGSIIGFSAYIWLLKVADPILVTTNTYVNPVVAVMLGWILAGEQMTMNDALAAAIIILSVIIISKANNREVVMPPVEEKVANRYA
ncbi:drug/metabolite transporter (DMT)-like permease [Sporomusaceae bacterium BoRhaA]|uniref:EamA family transporter n=1 Tax=Pelorhabdus rhamnosifermentans TaxID=2772457 RepID=UPI001C05F541|nr:EamA family transporter [Pelorhabdus rhamnosifermentans]MBU2699530.1 drug/metabolite transporter (DMT)-like permease [Pelorhabdus rhamnosifermentans]